MTDSLIQFTLEELAEIHQDLQFYGSKEIIKKIESKYTYCSYCNVLVLNEEYQHHFDVTCPFASSPY